MTLSLRRVSAGSRCWLSQTLQTLNITPLDDVSFKALLRVHANTDLDVTVLIICVCSIQLDPYNLVYTSQNWFTYRSMQMIICLLSNMATCIGTWVSLCSLVRSVIQWHRHRCSVAGVVSETRFWSLVRKVKNKQKKKNPNKQTNKQKPTQIGS